MQAFFRVRITAGTGNEKTESSSHRSSARIVDNCARGPTALRQASGRILRCRFERGEDLRIAAMLGVERIGRDDGPPGAAICPWRPSPTAIRPLLLLATAATIEGAIDVGIQADNRHERSLQSPVDVGLRH